MLAKDDPREGTEVGEDVPGTCRLLTALESRAKLAKGLQ